MKIKVIPIKDLKNLKFYDGVSCLIPTPKGIIFINEKTSKITTEIEPGILKIETLDGFLEMTIENQGLCYFDQQQLFILLK